MDAITIAKEIWKKVNELERQKAEFKDAITAKVNAQVEYDKALAAEIVKLRCQDNPVSIVEKIAKGNIWQFTLAMETAEAMLKAKESNTRSTQAQLNGLQTIAKNFGEL
jgi:hypothetical protein